MAKTNSRNTRLQPLPRTPEIPDTAAARLASRALALRLDAAGRPLTLDENARSVEVVASTEVPALVMDWERWQPVNEVLLMSGCRLLASGSVPLLDSHSRFSVHDIIGSFRGMRIAEGASGPELVGTAVFSGTEDGEKPFRKVAEGHVTDVSIGYEVNAHIWVEKGKTAVVEGKTYSGPLRVATEWALRELSLCPVGADPNAKIRAASGGAYENTPAPAAGRQKKEMTMPKKETRAGLLARLRKALGLRAGDEEPKEDTEEVTDEELKALVEEAEAAAGEEDEDAARASSEEEKEKSRAGGRAAPAPGIRAEDPALAERQRILAIRNLSGQFSIPKEMEEKFVSGGVSIDTARAQVLDMIGQRKTSGPGFQVSMGETEREKFRAALADTLLLRCNLPLWKHEPGSAAFRAETPGQRSLREAAPGSSELRALPLSMLARECLIRSGQRVPEDTRAIVSRALTTTDLPLLLVETSRRSLMEAFEAAQETWRDWASTGIAVDFKKSTAIGLEGEVKPILKPEYGEYTEGKLAENAEEYVIREYGRKMIISRQALINDDLNAFTALPRMYGEQTAEMVGDVAYAALLQAPAMGDGKPLFGVDHHNLYPGSGGAPTVANLGAVVTGMKLQKDSFGKTITVQPRFYLAPVALEVASEQFFNTQLQGGAVIGSGEQPFINNPYGGNYFKRVYDRRLDEASPTDWYLAAQRGTVVVFFLGGVEAPYIEEQINFDTDGVETKVRMDVGAKAMRWVTLAKATAQAEI